MRQNDGKTVGAAFDFHVQPCPVGAFNNVNLSSALGVGAGGTWPAAAPPPEPLRFGDLEVDLAARTATLGADELELSRKEFDLLAELARNAGRVVTREDLMSRVWDENWFGSTKTLDVHMGWLRRKLGDAAADPRYIHTVRGVGFRFAEPDGEEL